MKIVTVVGTRPEIIRLSATIERLDQCSTQALVHTGQNYDYELSDVFFEELNIRRPDHFLGAGGGSVAEQLAAAFLGIEKVLIDERPDAFLVLGDTNSALTAIVARRLQIPVYHMEAGNRSFDENVPEEINRRIVDHVSDYNLVYTEHARRNLLSEGLHPRRIALTGSPMAEVLDRHASAIDSSGVLTTLGLLPGDYFLASLHRQENVDSRRRLASILESLERLGEQYGLPVLVSTHPRTRTRLKELDFVSGRLHFHKPWSFHDYLRLQRDAKCVISDSGSVSEESSILGFAAVTMRDAIERPEAIDAGGIIVTGTETRNLIDGVNLAISGERRVEVPAEYRVGNCSSRTVGFILSTYHQHARWLGIRPFDDLSATPPVS